MRAVPLLAITAALAVPGAAQAERVSCGQLITHDTRVSNDLTNCPYDGLRVGAGVSLNLAGHTIDGAHDGVGIRSAGNDVTIRNGSVREFLHGVTPGGTNNIVRRLLISDNNDGILIAGEGTGIIIERNLIRRNSEAGIFQSDFIGSALIRRNTVSQNLVGILQAEAQNTRFVRNLAVANTSHGISVDAFTNSLRRNTATDNGRLGINALGAIDAGGNRASGNADPRQCVGVVCR